MDHKTLKSLLKILREAGVAQYTTPELSLTIAPDFLGDTHKAIHKYPYPAEEAKDPYANFPDKILSPEELMYYSSGGLPPEDENN
jgi:hypothetical protein